MSYVENNLLPDEKVLHTARIHWMVYAPAIACFIAAVVFATAHPGSGKVFALLGFVLFLHALIYAKSTEFAVTNKRVISKLGWIRRSTVELKHDRVESFSLDQGILGRIFNFGSIALGGTGTGHAVTRYIAQPLEFRKAALVAMEAKS